MNQHLNQVLLHPDLLKNTLSLEASVDSSFKGNNNMIPYSEAITAYLKSGGILAIDPMTSHFSLSENIWYLISNRKLIATYCNDKLEVL